MKLHHFTHSPNSRKVTSLIGHLGLTLDMQHVNLRKGEQRTDAFLALNPNGKVPVLEDGDLVLWESHAILVYLASKHPQRGLLPGDPRGRAEVERWMSWLQSFFSPNVGKMTQERVFKKLQGGTPDEAVLAQGTAAFESHARILDRHLAGREFLCGALTIADFALGPWAEAAPMCALGYGDYPAVAAWLERLARLPGWVPQPALGQ
ncbi:MAG TPA: glutathione S-transferase family protein [Haliangium sp.]|nr:glutathione S-transferase family protein [Haliangium sp.]